MSKIHILRPSSHETGDLLGPRIGELRQAGFEVESYSYAKDPNWLYTAGSLADRSAALNKALLSEKADIIWCARGGYGASDLLPHIDWRQLSLAPPKLVVGFSDISAIHAALYSHLNWMCLHAPMPATTLWRADNPKPGRTDVDHTLEILHAFLNKTSAAGELTVAKVPGTTSGSTAHGATKKLQGRLFGGCFSVLTSLIGTPYLPRNLDGHILFFEDIGENPGQLMRALNQWQQAGMFKGVTAIVIGYLKQMGEQVPDCADFVYQEFARRVSVPIFKTTDFGHISPNRPILIGANALIAGQTLQWQHSFGGATNIG